MFQWENQLFSNLLCIIDRSRPQQDVGDRAKWSESTEGQYSIKVFIDYADLHIYPRTLSKQVVSFIRQKRAPPRAC